MICEASSSATDDRSDLSLISPPPRSFTQQGRDDILVIAIGRPEHPRYVCGVGGGVGIKQFFGGTTRRTNNGTVECPVLWNAATRLWAANGVQLSDDDAGVENLVRLTHRRAWRAARARVASEFLFTLAQLTESDKKVLRNEFKKDLFPELRDELFIKGSSPLPEESGDDGDVPIDCELNIDDPPRNLLVVSSTRRDVVTGIHSTAVTRDLLPFPRMSYPLHRRGVITEYQDQRQSQSLTMLTTYDLGRALGTWPNVSSKVEVLFKRPSIECQYKTGHFIKRLNVSTRLNIL
ncbi:hypothetical protein V8G54_027953 [Vigna mungo]|uniref:Uncharacterized protein n=1 Tax=Vigna mungo TaxID=3915 RepID=A0AAQ3RK54_VIGMU